MAEHRELLNAIEREFIQLGYCWAMFRQLFDSGQDNIDLLNKSGSNVFQLLQKLLIDDLMMRLCRLSDPPKSMGYENASLRNLAGKLAEQLPPESRKKIDEKFIELNEHLKKVRILRNKALSHTDLAHALNTELLPRPTYDELEGAIGSATSILNELTGRVFDYSSDYIPHILFGHDGNKLLSVLAKAHGHRQSEG
jgi:AbiU2